MILELFKKTIDLNLNWLLPETNSEIDLTRAKILSTTCIAFSIITLILSPIALYFTHSNFPFFLLSIAMLSLALVFKYTGSLILVGNILCCITYTAFFLLIPKTGGIFSEDLHSMFIVPLAAFVLVGYRSGIVWSAISFITIGYFYSQINSSVDVLAFRSQLVNLNANYYLVISCINILIACVLSTILIRENQKLVKKIEGQNTALENSNSKLLKTEAKLKHRNNELNKFASIVSHDLQQPIRTIQNFSEILREHLEENGNPSSPQLTYIKFIEEGSGRMKRLVTDLLDYARSTKKQKDFHFSSLDDILNEVIMDLDNQISNNNVLIRRKPLPKANVVPVRIYQVFQNLISNALKFKKDGQQLVLDIYAIEKEKSITIAIKDNGIGIKEIHIKDIFEPFKKLHSKNEYEGSGIGLSTCQNIVGIHKGKLWVESTYGEGSTFFFSISKKLKAVPKATGQRRVSSSV